MCVRIPEGRVTFGLKGLRKVTVEVYVHNVVRRVVVVFPFTFFLQESGVRKLKDVGTPGRGVYVTLRPPLGVRLLVCRTVVLLDPKN